MLKLTNLGLNNVELNSEQKDTVKGGGFDFSPYSPTQIDHDYTEGIKDQWRRIYRAIKPTL